MDPNAVAGMIFTLLLFMLIGGFIVLLPLTRRLGTLLESKVAEKKQQDELPPQAIDELVNVIRDLETQVRRLAERHEFTEQLLESGERDRALKGSREL
jgi:hypothetical protein